MRLHTYSLRIHCWQVLATNPFICMRVSVHLCVHAWSLQITTVSPWRWMSMWRYQPAKPQCSGATNPKCSSVPGTLSAICWPRGECLNQISIHADWLINYRIHALACMSRWRCMTLWDPWLTSSHSSNPLLCWYRVQFRGLHSEDLEPEREQ